MGRLLRPYTSCKEMALHGSRLKNHSGFARGALFPARSPHSREHARQPLLPATAQEVWLHGFTSGDAHVQLAGSQGLCGAVRTRHHLQQARKLPAGVGGEEQVQQRCVPADRGRTARTCWEGQLKGGGRRQMTAHAVHSGRGRVRTLKRARPRLFLLRPQGAGAIECSPETHPSNGETAGVRSAALSFAQHPASYKLAPAACASRVASRPLCSAAARRRCFLSFSTAATSSALKAAAAHAAPWLVSGLVADATGRFSNLLKAAEGATMRANQTSTRNGSGGCGWE